MYIAYDIKKWGLWIGILICFIILLFQSRMQYQQYLQQSLARKVIRFHVLANSDDQEDQTVKYRVRDGILCYVEGLLKDTDSMEESRKVIRRNLRNIEGEADRILTREGVNYKAKAKLTHCDFPVKSYDGLQFPAGRYEAVQVLLGEGKGHNWWCVMYPNLCFSSSMGKEHVKAWNRFVKSLTPEEWEMVIKKKKYKIRWKFLEYLRKRR